MTDINHVIITIHGDVLIQDQQRKAEGYTHRLSFMLNEQETMHEYFHGAITWKSIIHTIKNAKCTLDEYIYSLDAI